MVSNVKVLREMTRLMGYAGLFFAVLSLICAGIAWIADLEMQRQEAYKSADDEAAKKGKNHAR